MLKKIIFRSLIFIFVFQSITQSAESEGMPQLNPEFWYAQIFWLVIIFLVLYISIWKVFLPKISNSIENRKSKIIKDLNDTQKIKEQAEKKLQEYNKILQDSKNEAKKIIEENRKKLDDDIEKKKKIFYSEIEKELIDAEQEIEKTKKTSSIAINKIASEISSEIIRKIIGAEVNSSSVAAIVENISKERLKEN